jgi:hypothetical protein
VVSRALVLAALCAACNSDSYLVVAVDAPTIQASEVTSLGISVTSGNSNSQSNLQVQGFHSGGTFALDFPSTLPAMVTVTVSAFAHSNLLATGSATAPMDGTPVTVALASPWSTVSSGTSQNLSAVWSTSGGSAWAVGDGGTVVDWNGSSWSPSPSGVTTPLRAITGTDGPEIWAVGDAGTILHWRGGAWSTEASNTTSDLYGVLPGFVVGAQGTILGDIGTINGAWMPKTSPTSGNLRAITSAAAVIVGDGGTIVNGNALTPSQTTNNLFGVSSYGPDACAVGEAGTILHIANLGQGPVDTKDSGTQQTLRAVWIADNSHMWAAGDGGTILAYDGSYWSSVPSGTTANLHGIWGTDSDVWAVGDGGTIVHMSR